MRSKSNEKEIFPKTPKPSRFDNFQNLKTSKTQSLKIFPKQTFRFQINPSSTLLLTKHQKSQRLMETLYSIYSNKGAEEFLIALHYWFENRNEEAFFEKYKNLDTLNMIDIINSSQKIKSSD